MVPPLTAVQCPMRDRGDGFGCHPACGSIVDTPDPETIKSSRLPKREESRDDVLAANIQTNRLNNAHCGNFERCRKKSESTRLVGGLGRQIVPGPGLPFCGGGGCKSKFQWHGPSRWVLA